MAIKVNIKNVEVGVGDVVKIYQKISEGEKQRVQFFEGMVIGIKGEGDEKTITVRRIGEAQIGIEKIYGVNLPSIEKIEVKRKGVKGVKQSKLYYTRGSSKREIEKIYSREKKRK
jgi:large subunit ribosomal protein L19